MKHLWSILHCVSFWLIWEVKIDINNNNTEIQPIEVYANLYSRDLVLKMNVNYVIRTELECM